MKSPPQKSAPDVKSQMATDIEFQFEKMELSKSGLVILEIKKTRINYDKYNPKKRWFIY